jgi:hypothetical protein
LPSLLALALFVYGFLGWNIRVSLSSWRGLLPAHDFVGLTNYTALFSDPRFMQFDVPNIAIFTLVFVVGSLALGFFMALLLDRGVPGEHVFRSIYLFPMAISFIATAIIWRWLMDNGEGEQRQVAPGHRVRRPARADASVEPLRARHFFCSERTAYHTYGTITVATPSSSSAAIAAPRA